MAKIDKTKFTKEEWHEIREQRRIEKAKNKKQQTQKSLETITVQHSNRRLSQMPPDSRKTAVIIGNGTSRKPIDLESLKSIGTTYGCNAIYREFEPDYLIAVDAKMILEFNKNRVQHTLNVWTNPNKAYTQYTGFNFFNPSKGWSSGPTALWKASEDKHDLIYIIGFDYQGIGANKDLVNNVYAGTPNYKKINDKATYFGNWLKQTTTVIKTNPNIQYVRVIDSRGFVPKELSNLPNLEHISTEDFQKILEKTVGV